MERSAIKTALETTRYRTRTWVACPKGRQRTLLAQIQTTNVSKRAGSVKTILENGATEWSQRRALAVQGTSRSSAAFCFASAFAARICSAQQPVQPPLPTAEQLSVPVRPADIADWDRTAQLWL